MRTFIASLLVSTVALGGLSAAYAADAVDQIPEAPVAQNEPAPAATWQGFYLGGAGTYNIGRFGDNYNARAIGAQIYSGYNWQQGQIVYGLEGDIGYSGADGGAPGGVGKNEVNGSVRGRVGYDLNPFLVYGTGGLALTKNKFSNAAGSDSDTAVGYTVGAGAEAFVTNNITARVEYRYTNYQHNDFEIGGATIARGYDEHSVKVGIGMKF
ncbi:porin family protein [Rhizobium grahamii]|uniref:Porin family protein n=1 Tax=Rhizobium grahamii TaxID=1120045 RepID=A0A5Q0C6I9_9HYPH|nr:MULTISPECIES: outer membrane protein [Rhizobium]QFY59657.1 porin family protein [Rhizobium grahamii]QRM51232.1 porin family protein [Rhizobium sp. BG6]